MRVIGSPRGWSRGRRILLSLLIGCGLAVGWSESPAGAVAQEVTPPKAERDVEVVLGDLAEELALTAEQQESIRQLAAASGGRARDPGRSWQLAADLRGILTSEQIETLRARLEEMPARMAEQGFPRHRAAPRAGRGERVTPRHGFMQGGPAAGLEDLDLTDEQAEQIETIRDEFRPRFEEVMNARRAGSMGRDEARDSMESLHDAMHGEIEGVLTEDQRSRLAERRAEAEARRESRQARPTDMGSAQWDAMAQALELSEEQQAALEALHESMRSQGPPADVAERDARRQAHQAAVREILTDEQQEVWVLHQSLGALFGRHGPARGPGGRRDGPRGPGAGAARGPA